MSLTLQDGLLKFTDYKISIPEEDDEQMTRMDESN